MKQWLCNNWHKNKHKFRLLKSDRWETKLIIHFTCEKPIFFSPDWVLQIQTMLDSAANRHYFWVLQVRARILWPEYEGNLWRQTILYSRTHSLWDIFRRFLFASIKQYTQHELLTGKEHTNYAQNPEMIQEYQQIKYSLSINPTHHRNNKIL